MARADVNGIELDYVTTGVGDAGTLVLLSGLGEPRTWWPTQLVSTLTDRGFGVVTFDHRDAGRSTKLEEAGKISQAALMRALQGGEVEAPYSLADMAEDVVGLLDHLDLDRASIIGRSMGAMVAQHLGFSHPARVHSLVLMMSTTGSRDVGQPTDEAWATMMATPPRDRDGFVDHWLDQARVTGGPLLREEELRDRAQRIYDHGYYPEGVARQFLAILTDGDRSDRLGRIDAPSLVIHGAEDTVVDVSGGVATAKAIPDADLVVLDDMGHDLPHVLVDEVADLITTHVTDASERSPG